MKKAMGHMLLDYKRNEEMMRNTNSTNNSLLFIEALERAC
jgi:hypothetical protein